MIEQARNKQINAKLYTVLLLGIVCLRLVLALCQHVFLTPNSAGLDDGLMFAAAQYLAQGEGFGPYGAFTIAKTMGFALWLFFVHISGVPYLLANALLWLLCCGFALWALRPIAPGNLLRVVLFALFAFLPTSFAFFTLRVYRDAIFSSFCLLLFAGVLGLALRAKETKTRGRWCASFGVGTGLVGVFLLREDGLVLLPFALCGLLLLLLCSIKNDEIKQKKQLVFQCVAPFGVLLAGIFGFSLANYMQYGVFMINDNTQGSFPGAYGAIVAVAREESEYQRFVPVPNEALDKLLQEVPSLQALEPSLEEGPVYNGFYNKERDGYGGSFYYALRFAADLEGLTETAREAQHYWAAVQSEVELAVAEGRLESAPPSQSTVPSWNAQLLEPLVLEIINSLRMTLFFEDIHFRPLPSEEPQNEATEMAAWLNTVPQADVYEAGTDNIYYNALQKAIFAVCDGLIWAYRVLIWPMLTVALYQTGKVLWPGARSILVDRRLPQKMLYALLSLGLLLSYLLRVFVAAYLEVAAFDIGTYLMYLASGMPALMLFCVFGCLQNEGKPGEKEIA